jgi:MFS family permease
MKLRRNVLLVFILLGLVSLFADIVYEGGRSISGAYLATLNAPPQGPAIIGLGEFIGLLLRLLSGYVSAILQSSLVLWSFTFIGYAITAFSIPMIAYAPSWEVVVALYVADRVGKGLRAPARDVILAEVSESIGVGKGFGIHELLDQLGAFAGPLLVGFLLIMFNYKIAYLALLAPGLVSIALVATAWRLYPSLKSVSTRKPQLGVKGYGGSFWIYTLATSILALGFMHWSIASYYLKSVRGAISDAEIGFIYAIGMVVDALVAVPLGVLFDKYKFKVLLLVPLLSPLFIVILTHAPRELLYLAAIPWGVIACSEESIMRATIALLVEPSKRPLAYGLFGLVFGLAWAIGGFIYSAILHSVYHMILFSTTTGLISLLLYTKLAK